MRTQGRQATAVALVLVLACACDSFPERGITRSQGETVVASYVLCPDRSLGAVRIDEGAERSEVFWRAELRPGAVGRTEVPLGAESIAGYDVSVSEGWIGFRRNARYFVSAQDDKGVNVEIGVSFRPVDLRDDAVLVSGDASEEETSYEFVTAQEWEQIRNEPPDCGG